MTNQTAEPEALLGLLVPPEPAPVEVERVPRVPEEPRGPGGEGGMP